jgi:NADPH-dependent 2,4-dienoyl-CoA reductase/sulfur reductase-like enzyme
MANYVASSDGVSVVQIFPERNTVKLENGTEIEYEQLVLALGMKEDNDDIKGFKEAWNDDMCPVYTTLNSTKWTAGHAKETRWIGNYNHGDAYFYIPKYPFKGEIAAYHFLQAWDYWEYYRKIGKLSPLSSLTVVNANDTFSQFDKEAHEYILKECNKRGIKVLFNTQLTEVKGNERKITLRSADGSSVDRDFNNLYVLPKAHVPDVFEKSGLAVIETNLG